MTSVHTANRATRPGLAIGGGVLAGLLTVAAVSAGLWMADRSADAADDAGATTDGGARAGIVVGGVDLRIGDCLNFTSGDPVATFALTTCDDPHVAQITDRIAHPSPDEEYPGAAAVAQAFGDRCEASTAAFLGTPVLETTLAASTILPDFDDWNAGDRSATCYVRRIDSTSLTASVEGLGVDHLRGEVVVVSRLIAGDCFRPAEDVDAYELNSNSEVELVPCDAAHNGVFFGRARLDFPVGTLFPGEDEVGDATSDRCSRLFDEHFGKSSDGFNYRYWRPNQQSWDLDDRTILCAILDSEAMSEPFEPADFSRFFDLAIGDCFNLGPEETSDSLRLDDQVRVVACGRPHVGQMIGSGQLDVDETEPFPPDDGVLQLAGGECEQLFVDFVGISPYESELGNFPFWYPNEPGWEDGDRRFACAFLEVDPRTQSLENAEA